MLPERSTMFDIKAPKTLPGKMITYITNSDTSSENKYVGILLGDLFEQQFTTTPSVRSTTGADVINDSNDTITVEVVSTIKLKGTKSERLIYANYLQGKVFTIQIWSPLQGMMLWVLIILWMEQTAIM